MHSANVLIELGAVVVGLAVLARAAGRLGVPTIPLYLLAGLAFGEGGIFPLVVAEEFIEIGAQIGLILLLFLLGLEYSAQELITTVRSRTSTGILDFVLNFTPGLIVGLLLDWDLNTALLLGGVTYVTSSGIVAKLVHDFRRAGNRETPTILSLLVIEDLAMAVYLPVVAGLLASGSALASVLAIAGSLAGVALLLALALKIDVGLSRIVFSHSDEALLLTILGITILTAGLAERLQVSAAVAALLVGIILSGPAAQGARQLLAPLRDLFAALFFAFIGLSIEPGSLPDALPVALVLAAVGAITKFSTGWVGAGWAGIGPKGRVRAGLTLIPRGEFSLVIAGVGIAAGVDADFGPVAIAYVLVLAVGGPVCVRFAAPTMTRLMTGSRSSETAPPGDAKT
ncbi:MAG: cation:proton antiporter [Actinomycetota bacterium]